MAGEPESLHSHEPLKARVERLDYDRLLMLSDGVLAIAITLLALELRLPEHWDGSVESLISTTGRPLIGYLFGFGLVGAFWFMHRRLFARLAVRLDARTRCGSSLIAPAPPGGPSPSMEDRPSTLPRA